MSKPRVSGTGAAHSWAGQPLHRRALMQRGAMLGLALPVLGALGTQAPSPAAAQESGSGGVLVFDLGSEPENLDPHQMLAYTTSLVVYQMFEGLVRFAPGTLEVEPWLAESWESSEDGLDWTFILRKGVTFHDGTPFNADAVKFSFDRQMDESSPFYKMGQWSTATDLAIIDSVTVDGEDTVTFHLAGPYSKFLSRMTGALDWIVSPTAVEQYGEAFLENPVGTGPYQLDRWEKGQQVVLRRNETWWNGTPGLDEIYFRAIPEEGARLAALLSGEVNMSLDVGPETVDLLRASDAHTVATGPTGAIWFLAMNVESEPFKDVKVRQAVNYAVDKRAIVEDVLRNTVETAYGPLSPGFEEYNPKVETYFSYDPEKAAALLAEAGWPADREVVFRCSIGGSGMLLPEEMATVIQDNLRAIGMQARLEVTEFVSWMDAIRSDQNELTVMSWNVAPTEPDYIFNGVLTKGAFPPGFNTSHWTDEELEQLVADALVTADPAVARANYERAQEIVMERAPIVPVCHRQQIYGYTNSIKNFAPSPSMMLDLIDVWIEN
ncbi:MAG: ABC transporter substrate-binding protein [Thermomicrobiales bacterium]